MSELEKLGVPHPVKYIKLTAKDRWVILKLLIKSGNVDYLKIVYEYLDANEKKLVDSVLKDLEDGTVQ